MKASTPPSAEPSVAQEVSQKQEQELQKPTATSELNGKSVVEPASDESIKKVAKDVIKSIFDKVFKS